MINFEVNVRLIYEYEIESVQNFNDEWIKLRIYVNIRWWQTYDKNLNCFDIFKHAHEY